MLQEQLDTALRQEKAAQERATELAKANDALQSTIDAMAAVEDLDQFVPAVLQIVGHTFETENCSFYENYANEPIYLRYWMMDNRVFRPDELLKLDSERFKFVRQLAGGFHVSDAYLGTPPRERTRAVILDHTAGTSVPELDEFCCANGWNIELNVPLVVDGFADGRLVIYRPTGATFTSSEISLAETLGKQLALAMQASRLATEGKSKAVEAAIAYEQERAAQARVAQLAHANTTLKKTIDILATEPVLDRSLGHVLQVTTEHLGSSAAALWLANPDGNTFSLHLVYLNGSIIPATPEYVDQLNGQWTRGPNLPCDLRHKTHIRERAPIIYDVATCPEMTPSQRQFMESLGVQTLLGIPLLLNTEVVGSFTVRFREWRQFSAEELEMTQALAHQATLVIQLRQLADEAKQTALLEERNRMAREIHDTLAQAFTGISLHLGIAQRLAKSQSESICSLIEQAIQLAHTGLAEARRSVWELHPEAEAYRDIVPLLQRVLQQMTSGTGVQAQLQVQGTPYYLLPEVGLNLLRIGQEALTNALRYAAAQHITIKLQFTSVAVRLQVEDDGCGFDPNTQIDKGGFGLVGMQQRCQRLGAQLRIDSQPGQGTAIVVEVPHVQAQVVQRKNSSRPL